MIHVTRTLIRALTDMHYKQIPGCNVPVVKRRVTMPPQVVIICTCSEITVSIIMLCALLTLASCRNTSLPKMASLCRYRLLLWYLQMSSS